jgi:hypothetical protein
MLVLKQSLPTLDLAQAGIEFDRRAETVLSQVNEYLAKYVFHIEPAFNPITVYGVGIYSLASVENISQLKAFGKRRITSEEVNEIVDSTFKEVVEATKVSARITVASAAVPGLDISKIIWGHAVQMCCLLLPESCFKADGAFTQLALTYAQYTTVCKSLPEKAELRENAKKQWFRNAITFGGYTRRRIREFDELQDSKALLEHQLNTLVVAVPK